MGSTFKFKYLVEFFWCSEILILSMQSMNSRGNGLVKKNATLSENIFQVCKVGLRTVPVATGSTGGFYG
jgi:hypothetical protein